MDPAIVELIKSLLGPAFGVGAAWLGGRGLANKVKKLEDQNKQQQGNVDTMQTSLINQLAQLSSTQSELIQTKSEVAELKDRIQGFEVKSNEDEIIKQSLRGRIAELEEICSKQEIQIERQELEIETLKRELAQTKTRITVLEN